MIFSIQRYLEDYFSRCGFLDPDQYAIALARLYDRQRQGKTSDTFLLSMAKMRTAFFRANSGIQRPVLERKILSHLDGKFKKKVYCSSQTPSLKGLRNQVVGSQKARG
jgi:hypothetical protein